MYATKIRVHISLVTQNYTFVAAIGRNNLDAILQMISSSFGRKEYSSIL